jgi:ATP-dependent Clp protease ATP-binding subunit ClpA
MGGSINHVMTLPFLSLDMVVTGWDGRDMFERFTSEGRRALQLASASATARGDAAITSEHLLLALADPASGLSADLLSQAGVDEAAVAAAMPEAPGGVGPVTPPFTAGSKKALELALREALNLAHNHIGTGHLLLGLLRLDEGETAKILGEKGVTLDATREVVRERSEGPRLGGRRRPRRTGRVVEAPTAFEQAKAKAAAAAEKAETETDEDVAVRLATEEGTRLQRALAALGVSPTDLQDALDDVAAEPVGHGPVELDLGSGVTLTAAAGSRAADLRSLVAAADHVDAAEDPDGTLRASTPALGDAVWATLEGWLTA